MSENKEEALLSTMDDVVFQNNKQSTQDGDDMNRIIIENEEDKKKKECKRIIISRVGGWLCNNTICLFIIKIIRLVGFVIVLLPAFVVFGFYYFTTNDRKSYKYKQGSTSSWRHTVDVYGGSSCVANDNNNKNATTTTQQKKDEQQEEGLLSSNNIDKQDNNNKQNNNNKKPIVIFITGGAWIIGYKMWGALMARFLTIFGIITVIPDYRNYPQTNIIGMMDDIDYAIQWTFDNAITKLGGDPKQIIVVGQSAGAHIGMTLLCQKLQQTLLRSTTSTTTSTSTSNIKNEDCTTTTTTWNYNDIKGFVATSGPYNLIQMEHILHANGIDANIIKQLFQNNLKQFSPVHILENIYNIITQLQSSQLSSPLEQPKNDDIDVLLTSSSPSMMISSNNNDDEDKEETDYYYYDQQQEQEKPPIPVPIAMFPPVLILHGTNDIIAPYSEAKELYKQLHKCQQLIPNVTLKLYNHWSHTDPILEAPMDGNHEFHLDVYHFVQYCCCNNNNSSSSNSGDGITKNYGGTNNNNNNKKIIRNNNNNNSNNTRSLYPFFSGDIESIENFTRYSSSSSSDVLLVDETIEEGKIRGGNNYLLMIPKEKEYYDIKKFHNHPVFQRICPSILIALGRKMNPF